MRRHDKRNLSWWDYVDAAFQTIRLIWKYGPQGAKEHIDKLNAALTKDLFTKGVGAMGTGKWREAALKKGSSRLKYKP